MQFEGNMALPVISNQKMDEYIKELGELAEMNEPVRDIKANAMSKFNQL